MALASEVGLQLLLCPLNSNIVIRTACCSVGIVLPVYSTFKAIEKKDQNEQQRWLLYWTAYGTFSVAEVFADKLLFWFPAYYYVKFAFLVWLQLPTVDGAKHLYSKYIRPFMLRHQRRFDQIAEFVYGELGKFVSAHQAEFLLARKFFTATLASAKQIIKEVVHPTEGPAHRAIEGPQSEIAGSDIEGPRSETAGSESQHED